MKVSVLVPSYNHETYIEECIDSILSQTHKDLELIISDDNSKDKTIKKIKKYSDKRIRLFDQKKNLGICKNLNFLTKKIQGKFFCYSGSDDFFDKYKIERQLNFMLAKKIDFSFTHVNFINNKSEFVKDNDNYMLGNFNVNNRPIGEWFNTFFYKGNILNAPTSMFRESLKKIIYFDEKYEYSQDFKVYIDLMLLGKKFDILNEKLTYYRLHQNNNSKRDKSNINKGFLENFLIKEHIITNLRKNHINSYLLKDKVKNNKNQKKILINLCNELLKSNNIINQIFGIYIFIKINNQIKKKDFGEFFNFLEEKLFFYEYLSNEQNKLKYKIRRKIFLANSKINKLLQKN